MKDNYKCFICHGSFFGVQKCCLIEFYWLFQSHTHTHSLTPSPPPILLLTLTIDEHVTHEPTFLTQKEDGKERGKIKLARKKKKENHREGNKLLDNFTEHRERERDIFEMAAMPFPCNGLMLTAAKSELIGTKPNKIRPNITLEEKEALDTLIKLQRRKKGISNN